ncbi:MAG: hypothetical protein A2162_02290 [Deltaproteobacteria bacterium RBG_13_52_11b]|nr:MAG: hypothetical protein A2162_02290 [Deltaproteobacteria bacterium RBG_13_52_11b]
MKVAPTEPPSVEKLQKASEHLQYEVWMMRSLPREYALAQQALASAQQAVAEARVRANALLEAFVVHARVLMEFLYNDKPKRDGDVVAVMFFDTPDQWTGIRKPFSDLSDELQKVKDRVGKEVAHLTFRRNEITAETKSWQLGMIAQELSAVFAVFRTHVPENKLSSIWFQAVEGMQSTTETTNTGMGSTGPSS